MAAVLIISPHNGNFLGCLEIIIHTDPLLLEHLAKCGNIGRGYTIYLPSTVSDEFIGLLAKKVLNAIVQEITDSRHHSIVLDSTPDVRIAVKQQNRTMCVPHPRALAALTCTYIQVHPHFVTV